MWVDFCVLPGNILGMTETKYDRWADDERFARWEREAHIARDVVADCQIAREFVTGHELSDVQAELRLERERMWQLMCSQYREGASMEMLASLYDVSLQDIGAIIELHERS